MLNQVVIVGRLVKDPTLEERENGGNYGFMTLAVPRSYKNMEGVYETDFIDCVLWNGVASNVVEYCHKGDLVGIKGRIQTRTEEVNEEKKKITELIAEKVTFLSSKSQ